MDRSVPAEDETHGAVFALSRGVKHPSQNINER